MSFRAEEVIQEVAPGLARDVRASLLDAATAGRPLMGETFGALVGDDDDLCRAFFSRSDLSYAHRTLLEGEPDQRWIGRVKVALAVGFEPREIASATVLGSFQWTGAQSAFWATRRDAFRDVVEGADEPLQEVLVEAAHLAEERSLHAAEKERREAIFGD
jgi:hypothetical protein